MNKPPPLEYGTTQGHVRNSVNCGRIHDTIEPANMEMLQQQDFLAADWAYIIKECQWAGRAIQDFYKKSLFVARLYGEIWTKVMRATAKRSTDVLVAAIKAETLIADAQHTGQAIPSQ